MKLISESLLSGLDNLPAPGSAESASLGVERILEAVKRTDEERGWAYWEALMESAEGRRLIDSITGNSPFLTGLIASDPDFAASLICEGPGAVIEPLISFSGSVIPDETVEALMARLRVARRHVALTTAMADMTGAWPVERVTEILSDFAERAISEAVAFLLRRGHDNGNIVLPEPEKPETKSGFIVLGMGKLGAHELNYSSDIDLILLYDHEQVRYEGRRSIQEFFTRLARDLVRVLEERTRDGYVFRTDLRLRPDPGSTPPVISTLAAETYYEGTGQNWERAAMIKARPVGGDREAGAAFLEILRPFIWRRSLDFAAIQDIHSIKRQINAVRGGAEIAVAGHNIKLGRGGIREIEFFAQTQQLIWGGRDATLRIPATCDALNALLEAGHIKDHARDDLIDSYRFLRTLEHRLQMVDDQQTHEIPNDPEKIAQIAAFAGFGSVEAFEKKVTAVLRIVEDHYAELFEEEAELGGPGTLVFTGGEDHPDTLKTLTEMGFESPETASSIIRNWHHGRFRALRSARARELLTEMAPGLLEAFSKSPDPDAALLRFNDFLSGLPAGVQLLSLIHTHPALFSLISEIMGTAPLLAETLKQHPILFDAVLSADFFDQPPSDQELFEEIEEQLSQCRDFEDVLDETRRQVNDRIFQIGVHMIRGRLAPADAGIHLTSIADAALRVLYPRVLADIQRRHGDIAGGGMAIVALGKMGGREITIGSDLDLLFIYDAEDSASSDGEKPLGVVPYFTRLGQRYLSAITSPTGQGILYEVDMRLRPSGNAGPLATSLAAFIEYHKSAAWTWEHMALTRARVVCANKELEERLDTAILNVLTQPRDAGKLLHDVADMRDRMRRDRQSAGSWDIKNMPGGLVDIEFTAQYLQLRYAHEHPEILSANTGLALRNLNEAGLLSDAHCDALCEALQLWRNLQGILRLTVGEDFDEDKASDATLDILCNSCGTENLASLKGEMARHADNCQAIFRELIEEPAALEKDDN